MLSNLVQLSLKERNETSSLILLDSRFQLEEHVLNNLSKKGFEDFADNGGEYKHWRLNFDIEDYFKRSIQFNEDEVGKNIIDYYRDFIVRAVPILFPKDFVYSQDHHFESARSAEMLFGPLQHLNNLVPIVISGKKIQLFQPIFTLYYTIEQTALSLPIDEGSKCFLLGVFYNYKYEVFSQYIGLSEIQHINYLNYPFKDSARNFQLTKCKNSYLGTLQVWNLLFAKGKLNTVVINEQKVQMMHLLELFKDMPESKFLIIKSINKFEEIAGKVKESDNDYKKDIYLILENYLKIVANYAIEKVIIDTEITQKFRDALLSFYFKDRFKQELAGKGYISDSRII